MTPKDSQVILLAKNMETPMIPKASPASLDVSEARTLKDSPDSGVLSAVVELPQVSRAGCLFLASGCALVRRGSRRQVWPPSTRP